MDLKNLQDDLLFGSLLGDGNLQTGNGGRTWRYRALHQSLHKEYLFHKYEILKPLCGTDTSPTLDRTEDDRTGRVYERWYFNTLTNPSLNYFANMFYMYDRGTNRWIKDVPSSSHVNRLLTPRALAYFFMDDGALKWLNHSNAMRICTESFSVDGVKRIQKALKELYGIKTTLTKKPLSSGLIGYRIGIPEEASGPFRKVIQPYLVDCMKYKVSDGNKGHL
jgi:hypothetical protein